MTSARHIARALLRLLNRGTLLGMVLLSLVWGGASASDEYLLTPGDVIKVQVFKNPDLSIESKIAETGSISFPLIGSVPVAGLSLNGAEQKIAQMLKDGGFVQSPQVNISLTLAVGHQASVLGEVNRPGRYPIEGTGTLTGVLAEAGGISTTGSDVVIVTGKRDGKPFRREIDVVKMSLSGNTVDDIELHGGDTLFVSRAPMFYIYGQVQHPGSYRLEKGMTVMQALADGGGVTGKGTSRGIVLHHRDASGKVKEESVSLDQDVRDQDVIYVKESVF
jgi:polysaccharide export outer membrane protein